MDDRSCHASHTLCLALAALTALAVAGAPSGAAGPTSKPASKPASSGDPATDFLLDNASEAPATRPASSPATRAASPFAGARDARQARPAVVLLSNGERIRGRLATTSGKPLRVFDERAQEYRDVAFAIVTRVESSVVWERDEPEWRFKDSGSDVKEFSGRTYPARELRYTLTLVNGQSVTGAVSAPLYVDDVEQPRTLVLYKRQKGEAGQGLKELVYVQRVEFDPVADDAAKRGK